MSDDSFQDRSSAHRAVRRHLDELLHERHVGVPRGVYVRRASAQKVVGHLFSARIRCAGHAALGAPQGVAIVGRHLHAIGAGTVSAATSLNLDVEAERVERMLVNVAAYGRERMPLGGRLMFDVAPVVVDRKFVTKYPNVRPGAHVLLTVNEVRGVVRPDLSAAGRNQGVANAIASASNGPGVDLGALQALVSDCGGHLWMMAQPPGEMVLKIHLPRRILDRSGSVRANRDASAPARQTAGVGHL